MDTYESIPCHQGFFRHARHLDMPHRCGIATSSGQTQSPSNYATYGSQAITNMINDFYTNGQWKACTSGCGSSNQDWGADSMTYTLFMRWKTE